MTFSQYLLHAEVSNGNGSFSVFFFFLIPALWLTTETGQRVLLHMNNKVLTAATLFLIVIYSISF